MAPSQQQLQDIQWLVGPEAAALLQDLAASPTPLHQQVAKLRKRFSSVRTHLLLEQVDLRDRARSKFPAADRLFFTALGLEQSTDAWVANYKARRLHNHMRVADLCCGIGGDLVAIAKQSTSAAAYDRSAAVLCLAEANADALGLSNVKFEAGDAELAQLGEFDAWHVDPDRRPTGKRTTQLQHHSPDQQTLDKLHALCPHAAIKLAPAAEPPESWQAERELEWISRGGQCKQLVVWSGRLSNTPGERRATALSNNGKLLGSVSGPPVATQEWTGNVDSTIYEPDAAVFAACLDGLLSEQLELKRISPESGYLTGPPQVSSPLVSAFAVEEVLPFRVKTIASLLRSRSIGCIELKSRGVDVSLPTLRKQLRLRGDNEATLLLTRIGKKSLAILAKRIAH